MPEHFETLLALLGQFTGTGGGARHPIVQFGLAAIFWAVLLAVARANYSERAATRDKWLIWAFAIGLARELFMIGVKVIEAYGLVDPDDLHAVFPPAEHALSNIALVLVAAAFVVYLTTNATVAKRYLVASVASVVAVYLATFWWWAEFITANPSSKFGQTWCDWLFRINASFWLGLVVVYLWKHAEGWKRNVSCAAISFFFLNEFLKIPDMMLDERYEHVFAPIRHAFYIAGIPLLGYVYAKELAIELKTAMTTLEQKVAERTAELRGTLAQLSDANQRLETLSLTDALTNIANRRGFDARFEEEWRRAARGHETISILLIDIDHFKAINDNYGHPFGDLVLAAVARVLDENCQRAGEYASRYGGEEFVVLVADQDVFEAQRAAERLRLAIADLRFEHEGQTVSVTVSIGVASTRADQHAERQDLVDRADAGLYEAKRAGRNRVLVSKEPPDPSSGASPANQGVAI